MATKKDPRGGPRENSGRPKDPEKKASTTLRLSLDIKAYMATLDNATEAIEAAIRGSKGYREWKRKG